MKLVGCRGMGGGGRPSPVLKNCCWSLRKRSVLTSWETVAPWEELLDWGGDGVRGRGGISWQPGASGGYLQPGWVIATFEI